MTVACLQTISAGFAVVAAILWFVSASIQIPEIIKTKLSGNGSITDLMQKQSRWSAFAALAAGASALTQAASLISS